MWMFRPIGLGLLALAAVVAGLTLTSPAVDPCPIDSPSMPGTAALGVAPDLFLDACVSVDGVVVSRVRADELVVEEDRAGQVRRVRVRGPEAIFERVSPGDHLRVAGRIRKHQDGGYLVHHGVDRGWWGNLRDNLPGDFFAP